MVLALQGGMAVGKTTAARYTAAHASAVTVFFEDNAPALAALRPDRDTAKIPFWFLWSV